MGIAQGLFEVIDYRYHFSTERFIVAISNYEMVCDRKYFGCFTPGESPKSLNYDVIAKIF